MRSSYKKLGPYIREVVEKNTDLSVTNLLGVSITKQFIPSIANTIGTDMTTYKVVRKNQFAYGPVTSRNGDKISVALLMEDEGIVSTSYTVFEIIDHEQLDPEYLMMWFRRPEFDRYARFKSHGSVREMFDWEEMGNVELPLPSIDKQHEIVREYNIFADRVKLKEQLIQRLENIFQLLYMECFVYSNPSILDGLNNNLTQDTSCSQPGESLNSNKATSFTSEFVEMGKISDYAKIKPGYAFKSEWWEEQGYPVIKIGSIAGNTINQNELAFVSPDHARSLERFSVKNGDIVIAMTGFTMGKVGVVSYSSYEKMYVNQRVGIFELGDNPISRLPFLFCTLNTQKFKNDIASFGGDSRQANISAEQIESIEIPLGDKRLITTFNQLLSPLFISYLLSHSEIHCLKQLIEILHTKLSTV